MNIFKILSSGDQKIKEPAVTSFLEYLLNPNEGHGMGAKFLEYFLIPIVEEEKNREFYKELLVNNKIKKNLKKEFYINVDIERSVKIVDDTIDENEMNENIEGNYEVEFDNNEKNIEINDEIESGVEAPLKDTINIKTTTKRKDIDVVIKLTNKFNRENVYIFCVENKIQDGGIVGKDGKQLEAQLNGYIKELKNEIKNNKISSIFLTHQSKTKNNLPDAYFAAFEKSKDSIKELKSCPSEHLYWQNDLDKKKSIYDFLKKILHEESVGEIEPIHDYTKYTIKAFMNFIDSKFKSIKDEKDDSKLKPQTIFITEDEYYHHQRTSKDKNIPENIIELSKLIRDLINSKYQDQLIYQYSPTHYSFFIKEFNYKPGTKLTSIDLYKNKIELLFNKKNTLSVKDKINLEYNENRYPNTIIYTFVKMTKNIEDDIKTLLNASYNSIIENNKN